MKTLLEIFKESSINSFTDYISLGKKIAFYPGENAFFSVRKSHFFFGKVAGVFF